MEFYCNHFGFYDPYVIIENETLLTKFLNGLDTSPSNLISAKLIHDFGSINPSLIGSALKLSHKYYTGLVDADLLRCVIAKVSKEGLSLNDANNIVALLVGLSAFKTAQVGFNIKIQTCGLKAMINSILYWDKNKLFETIDNETKEYYYYIPNRVMQSIIALNLNVLKYSNNDINIFDIVLPIEKYNYVSLQKNNHSEQWRQLIQTKVIKTNIFDNENIGNYYNNRNKLNEIVKCVLGEMANKYKENITDRLGDDDDWYYIVNTTFDKQ